MALGKEKDGGTYLVFKPSIGRLTIKSDSSDPEAKPRTYKDSKTNEEKTVYEQRYQTVSGKIVGLVVDTSGEYGSQLKVTVRDGETDLVVPLALNKSWGTKAAESLASVKLDEPVLFTAYGDFTTDDGKEVQAGLSVKQNGVPVRSAFNYKNDAGEWVRAECYPAYPSAVSIPDKTNIKSKYTKFWSDY